MLRRFFRKKVNKKLSTTPFATKGSAFISSSVPQSSDVEKKVNFSLCLDWIERDTYYLRHSKQPISVNFK
jgi:hypothetical protein